MAPIKHRVLFLNDIGFQYGAGIAEARQIESFLELGWEAGALSWEPGGLTFDSVAARWGSSGNWLGHLRMRHVDELNERPQELINAVTIEVAHFNPELIIVGNLHAARWPFELLAALQSLRCRVVVYLHDMHYMTGRCAYSGPCTKFLAGCDDSCPTADHYPPLRPEFIARQWQLRRDLFNGTGGIEVAGNSDWTSSLFRRALPFARRSETVYLGADENVFCPRDAKTVRLELNLPIEKPLVLCAAVNFRDKRKGGPALLEIIQALSGEVTFAAFGHNANEIPGLIGLGYSTNARDVARFHQAADIFLSTASEEAFGQTIMEAQLCGRPVVAFQTGGVAEIIRNELTGKLIQLDDVQGIISAIRQLVTHGWILYNFGQWGRRSAERRFSLTTQARRWDWFLDNHPSPDLAPNPPTIAYALSLADANRYRPSWNHGDSYISKDHEESFANASHIHGWQEPGDSWKLYEMGYHSGHVILEIGTFGGRSATIELRGALAAMRANAPKFYGIDIAPESISRTAQTLADNDLVDYCHLFLGTLTEFVRRWDINPTMVFLDGDHRYEGVKTDTQILASYLSRGVPVLIHDYLNTDNDTGAIGVRRAADEWIASGAVEFMGCFGCSALVKIK